MSKTKKLFSYIAILLIFAIPIIVVFNWQNIYDWTRLYGYTPSQEIQNIANDTTMNALGRKIFFVNHPTLNDRDTFNNNCREDEQSIVIGCFVQGKGIYIYDVKDPRLDGIHEVTSAHEMLHAAYERLGNREKSEVDSLLEQTFNSLKNERIIKTINSYKEKDSSSVPSEMHSIFGTELKSLPAELENYYKKYFKDRAAVVSLSEKYEQEFTRREELVKEYDTQLENLKKQIESSRGDIDYQVELIKSEKSYMDQLLKSKDYNAYNSKVDAYNNKVQIIESKIAVTNNLINQFNDILQKRNALATEQQELIQAIDSRITTAPN